MKTEVFEKALVWTRPTFACLTVLSFAGKTIFLAFFVFPCILTMVVMRGEKLVIASELNI